ncbi:MAG TPA: FtsX-like permease family protein, partial [Vicinamibacterales bacterium]|nr:FtsX-like permease family protein [Vicinamibacterales bacterium]
VATHNTWFGGVYQDPSNFFAQIVVEPEPFMKIYPEYKLPPEQMKAWLDDRQGAIVGVDLAKRFGWKLGDRIPIGATIWQPKGGGQTWEFNIAGIYDGGEGVDKTQFFFKYDYLDENRAGGQGMVGWYIVKIADASQSQAMGAKFDAMFENSDAETKTTTEKGFVEGFANQMGNIGAIMIWISAAVLFMMLLIAASTMVQAVRERTSEIAVLKTLGFSNTKILSLVLGESVFVCLLGGGLGLLVAWLIVQQGDPTGQLPIFILQPQAIAAGVALILSMGLLAGLIPALSAMQLKITDGLRRN